MELIQRVGGRWCVGNAPYPLLDVEMKWLIISRIEIFTFQKATTDSRKYIIRTAIERFDRKILLLFGFQPGITVSTF